MSSVTVVVSSPGPQGPAGPPGPTGPGGAASNSYSFTQSSPSAVWVVNHNLGFYANVSVIVGGEEVDADVTYNSVNSLTVSFASPQAGMAICS